MIIKNIKEFIDSKALSIASVERMIGVANGTLSKPIKTHKSIKTETLEKFLSCFTEINPCWLLSGKGNMLETPDNFIKNENLEDLIKLQREKIQNLEKELKELKNQEKTVTKTV